MSLSIRTRVSVSQITGILPVGKGGTGASSAGSGSGYDADLLDGQHAAGFASDEDLDGKADLAGWTVDRIIVSAGDGTLETSSVTTAELSHLAGVSSPIQTQLDAKAAVVNAITVVDSATVPSWQLKGAASEAVGPTIELRNEAVPGSFGDCRITATGTVAAGIESTTPYINFRLQGSVCQINVVADFVVLEAAAGVVFQTPGVTINAAVALAGTLGLFGASPVSQPAAIADATDATDVVLRFNEWLAAARSLGAIAS